MPNDFKPFCLIVQPYKDSNHRLIIHALTVQRVSHGPLLLENASFLKSILFFFKSFLPPLFALPQLVFGVLL